MQTTIYMKYIETMKNIKIEVDNCRVCPFVQRPSGGGWLNCGAKTGLIITGWENYTPPVDCPLRKTNYSVSFKPASV